MKFEVGKFYRTRSGHKAIVVYTKGNPFGSDTFPVQGYIDDGSSESHCWTDDGIYYTGKTSDRDIVAEWREPVRDEGYAVVSPDGEVIALRYFRSSAETWCERFPDYEGRIVRVRFEEVV